MRINLKKYGWEESKDENFSDDGNRFTVYRNSLFPELRISKLLSEGEVYLAARMEPREYNPKTERLCFEEYSKLEHFIDLDSLNGVSADYLNEERLANWILAIIEYYKEYKDKLNYLLKNDVPSNEELGKAIEEYIDLTKKNMEEGLECLNKISSGMLNNSNISFSDYSTQQKLVSYYRCAKTLVEDYTKALKKSNDLLENKLNTRRERKELLESISNYKRFKTYSLSDLEEASK